MDKDKNKKEKQKKKEKKIMYIFETNKIIIGIIQKYDKKK